jgi:hypothetical protein
MHKMYYGCAYLSIRPFNCVFKLALAEGDRIGQWEDDRARVELGHPFDNVTRKRSFGGRQAKYSSWLDVVDNFKEVLERWAVIIRSSKVYGP